MSDPCGHVTVTLVTIADLSEDEEGFQQINTETAEALRPGATVNRVDCRSDFLELLGSAIRNLRHSDRKLDLVHIGHGEAGRFIFQKDDLSPVEFCKAVETAVRARHEKGIKFTNVDLTLEMCYGNHFQQAVAERLANLRLKYPGFTIKVASPSADSAPMVAAARLLGDHMDPLILSTTTDFAAALAKDASLGYTDGLAERLQILSRNERFFDRVMSRTIGIEHAWSFNDAWTSKTVREFVERNERGAEGKVSTLLQSFEYLCDNLEVSSFNLPRAERVGAINAFIDFLEHTYACLLDATADGHEISVRDAHDLDLHDFRGEQPPGPRRGPRGVLMRRLSRSRV